jgi:hypothetical protein
MSPIVLPPISFDRQWGVVELRSGRRPEAGRISLVMLGGLPFLCLLCPNVDGGARPSSEPLSERTRNQGFTSRYFPLVDVTCVTELGEEEARSEAVALAFADLLNEAGKDEETEPRSDVVQEFINEARPKPAPPSKRPQPKKHGGLVDEEVTKSLTVDMVGELHGSEICHASSGTLSHSWLVVQSYPKPIGVPDHEAERMNLALWLECKFCNSWAELKDEP